MQKITAIRITNKLDELLKVKGVLPITLINSRYAVERDSFGVNGSLDLMRINGKYGYELITVFENYRIVEKFYNGKWEYVIILTLNKNRNNVNTQRVEMIDVYEWIYNTAGKDIE